MKKEYLAVLLFVKFGYNYPNPDKFINYICEKTGRTYLKDHLKEKFSRHCKLFGTYAVMNMFFSEIDSELQEALVDYAINVYAPKDMASKYEEYKNL